MTVAAEPSEAENNYIVRLLFQIPAASPKEAVEQYVEQILLHGLRNWSYRVEDIDTEERWHLDGYGEPLPPRPTPDADGDASSEDADWDSDLPDDSIPVPSITGDLEQLLRLSRGEEPTGRADSA